MLTDDDVPSPIDLRKPQDAVEWESTANEKRPWRPDFFRIMVSEVLVAGPSPRVLELGSGPGLLLEHLIEAVPHIDLFALDFSAAMHALAAKRLGDQASRVCFVERDLRGDWTKGLGLFDVVLTNQTVHELRHKRRAPRLLSQVRSVLKRGGPFLVCDHYLGHDGMSDSRLYMTVEEQREALQEADFPEVRELRRDRGLVLHLAS